MRCGLRLLCCGLLVIFVPLYLLERHLHDLYNQYHAGDYVVDWWKYKQPSYKDVAAQTTPGDKVIVMAKLEEEQTNWVEEELPDWQRAIYIVNPSSTDEDILTTPVNKGHESMAYLTYVIDHYDKLPSTIAFLHSHRSGFLMAWHVDAPLHDNVAAMRALQTPFVQQNGYVNLRCNWNPGCKENHRHNKHITEEVWTEVFAGTSTPPLNASESASIATDLRFGQDQKYMLMPQFVGTACCAQFAVSRDQVHKRPREDYVKIRQWIIDTDKSDAVSGRVMEFLWHVIFGMESVYCPDEELCYCQVYGQC
ncbi:DUF3431 domain-containing protein [Aspergillus chevalieri]|uniref:Uncharacterized protein n=1 Tax=Aspergillus chevalieri TaxID=182096 RepID=A0A7R7ZM68_ASPCH|nr:uncharacterized protein ACHE_21320S [Aspergillus chevalieri]BCR85862.1 hypothetical protein ACHE_21320S [Aspergillus chevalieri]